LVSGSGKPHPEGIWRDPPKWIAEALGSVSPAVQRKIGCETAGKLYGLLRPEPMIPVRGLVTTALVLLIVSLGVTPGAAALDGQMTWALHVALAPTWFDPAETSGIITPYVVLYALHDARVQPLPGNP